MALISKLVKRFRPPPDIEATQAWFRLDLRAPGRPHRPLEDTFELRECTEEDLPLLTQLPEDPAVSTSNRDLAVRRMAEDGTLWLSIEHGKVAFGCWTFAGRAPVFGGRDGGADLPAESVLLEDSLASPDFRGRGVAPATWSTIADRLSDRGTIAMYTKVDVTNIPSTKAVIKAGFREVGRMHFVRSKGVFRTTVTLGDAANEADRWLLELTQG